MADRLVNAEMVNDRVKLLFHRLIARRLGRDPAALDLVRAELARHVERYGAAAPWIAPWAELLDQGAAEVRAQICKRSERMTWLRISSPLAVLLDVLDPAVRRRIWRRCRLSLIRQAERQASLPSLSIAMVDDDLEGVEAIGDDGQVDPEKTVLIRDLVGISRARVPKSKQVR